VDSMKLNSLFYFFLWLIIRVTGGTLFSTALALPLSVANGVCVNKYEFMFMTSYDYTDIYH